MKNIIKILTAFALVFIPLSQGITQNTITLKDKDEFNRSQYFYKNKISNWKIEGSDDRSISDYAFCNMSNEIKNGTVFNIGIIEIDTPMPQTALIVYNKDWNIKGEPFLSLSATFNYTIKKTKQVTTDNLLVIIDKDTLLFPIGNSPIFFKFLSNVEELIINAEEVLGKDKGNLVFPIKDIKEAIDSMANCLDSYIEKSKVAPEKKSNFNFEMKRPNPNKLEQGL